MDADPSFAPRSSLYHENSTFRGLAQMSEVTRKKKLMKIILLIYMTIIIATKAALQRVE